MRFIASLKLLFCLISTIHGTHFLGGTVTWRPVNSSATGPTVDIIITQTYSYTYSRIPCTPAMIAASQLISIGGYSHIATQTLDCIKNCGAGSTGYIPPSIRPFCMYSSSLVGISVGQRLDLVTLQTNDDFSAAFQQTAWRPLATASSASWSISIHINLNRRSDNGLYNNPPVANLISPILIVANQITTIHIPVADTDEDDLRCRWATSSNGTDECGGVCPPGSLPVGTTIYPNCTILITGTVIGDWYAIALMVEDFVTPASTTALSSVPVQFLVQVVAPPACLLPPTILGVPREGICIPVIIGQPFTTQVIAETDCGSGVTIVDIMILAFLGLVPGSITQLNTTTYYIPLSLVPTSDQLGFQIVCAMAVDSDSTTTTTTTILLAAKTSLDQSAFIGILTAGCALAVLILACCTYWLYVCFCNRGRRVYDEKRSAVLYHIEVYTDPKLSRPTIFTNPKQKPYRVYQIAYPRDFKSRII